MWSILLIFSLLLIVIMKLLKNKSDHPLPPRLPGGIPILGHIHLLIGDSKKLWRTVQEFSKQCIQHGGVTYLEIGQKVVYVITDPEDAVVVANSCLDKHPVYNQLDVLWGSGLLTLPAEPWSRHRKILQPAYGVKYVQSLIELFNTQSRKLVDSLDSSGYGPVDVGKCLLLITLETSLDGVFGNRFNKDNLVKYANAIETHKELVTNMFHKIWLHNPFIFRLLGYKKMLDDIRTDLTEVFTEALKLKKTNESSLSTLTLDTRFRTFMELVLQMSEHSFTDEELKSEINTALITGFDTITSQMTLVLSVLAHHPDVQERIYQEIIKVLGKDRDVEKEDIPNLNYTDAVIKEAVRLYGPVPLILRQVHKEVKLKNYTLRANTECIISLQGINYHPVWIDGDKFKPERWLDPSTLPPNSNAYVGFGVGKRNCVGKTYAMVSMLVTLVHVIRAYRLSTDQTELECKFEVTLKIANECNVTCQRRT